MPSFFGFNASDEETKPKLSRILDRDGAFHQSRGRMAIRKRIHKKEWRALYGADLFHSLIDAPSIRCIIILLSSYMALTGVYAVLYYYTSVFYDCNLGLINLGEAFMFSLETMATIGYGTKDIFFDDCVAVGFLLSSQVSLKLVADALTIGIIYSRLSRPTRRASTVLFSNQAVIRRIRGKLYLMFQLCELRKHQLSEAHVRLYTIRRDRDYNTGALTQFQTCSMRLNHPDDELGSMLLLALPQCVVHEINAWSPLMPPKQWRDENGDEKDWEPSVDMAGATAAEQGVDLSFPTVAERSGAPTTPPRGSTPIFGGRRRRRSSATTREQREQDAVTQYMRDRKVEVVAIVEGVDSATGGTVQARHSYTIADIVWNHMFPPCVVEDADGAALIDFSLFHVLDPSPEGGGISGTFPSAS